VVSNDARLTTVAREWDAATYDQVATPQERWGIPVVERLQADGVDTVLDAGCGTGRVTQMVLDRVPEARVLAVDGSRQMLDRAARRLEPAVTAERVRFVHADLSQPLQLGDAVDAALSTATFHWIADHDTLFANLASVMRPGAQLVAQCGGGGNIASVVEAMREVGETWNPWNFSTPDDTRARLERAGFIDIETWLHDEPTEFASESELEQFLATVVLGDHLARRPDQERADFVRAVASALPSTTIDYVRLNIVATRE
jgi:trans-aconitate 2-methyltransferase